MESPNKEEKLKRMAQAMGVPYDQVRKENYQEAELLSSIIRMNNLDPMVTIRPDGIQFNNACIRLFEDVRHIYIGFDRDKQWMMINECDRDDIDSQRWCNEKDGRLVSRKITGKDHSNRIYKMMGWNKGYYYKVLAEITRQIGDETNEPYLLFELGTNRRFPLTEKGRKAAGVEDEDVGEEELAKITAHFEEEERRRAEAEAKGEKPKRRRTGEISGIAEDAFGTKRNEHVSKRSIQKGQKGVIVNQMTINDFMDTKK